MNTTKFYQTTWFTILMLIIFFPVGIFLMWKYKKFNQTARIIISIIFALVLLGDIGDTKTAVTTTQPVNTTVKNNVAPKATITPVKTLSLEQIEAKAEAEKQAKLKEEQAKLAAEKAEKEAKEKKEQDRQKKAVKEKALLSQCRTKYDEFQDTTFYTSKNTSQYINVNKINLYMGKNKDGYYLCYEINYVGKDWLNIKDFIIKTDNDMYTIEGGWFKNVKTEVCDNGCCEYVNESADSVIIEIFRDIAKSKTAKLRYNGHDHISDRTITSSEKAAIKTILDLYDNYTKN